MYISRSGSIALLIISPNRRDYHRKDKINNKSMRYPSRREKLAINFVLQMIIQLGERADFPRFPPDRCFQTSDCGSGFDCDFCSAFHGSDFSPSRDRRCNHRWRFPDCASPPGPSLTSRRRRQFGASRTWTFLVGFFVRHPSVCVPDGVFLPCSSCSGDYVRGSCDGTVRTWSASRHDDASG